MAVTADHLGDSMRSDSMMMALLGICVALAACSTNEPAPAARPTAQSAVAPRAGTVATISPTASGPASADAGASESEKIKDREMRSMGYTPETHNGRTVYCRKEAPTGSRFEKKYCATAEDVEAAVQAAGDFTRKQGATPSSN
jgi:hypothetical protein